MLDTIINSEVPAYPQHIDVKITENRAATDASIALFGELQQKARDSIVQKIVVNDNSFSLAYALFDDVVNGETIVRAKVMLNGRAHVIDVPYDESKFAEARRNHTVLQAVWEHFSKRLASGIFIGITKGKGRDQWGEAGV